MSGKRTETSKRSGKGDGKLVMVVDSDDYNLHYTSALLKRFEYRVSEARSAVEALQRVETSLPDLLLVEQDLPHMPALDLLANIRRDPRLQGVPAIVLAGSDNDAAEARHLEAGFACRLVAPVGAEELYRAVQAAIEPTPRGSLRIQTRLPVQVNNVPLDCVEGECASVISEHGMYVCTLRPHPANSSVTVRIAVNGRTIDADAVVLYCHQRGEGPFGEAGMGLRFAQIAEEDREHLRSYINQQLTKDILSRS
ncbi:MAG: response regulator [Nitrospiraceae bacterium]|nr:response regulator [Nitrospiraceae bacterium]